MSARGGRRRRWGWALLVLLVVVPLAEIYVLVQVGQVIGPGWTILLLVLDSIAGGWLISREGRRAWRALREAFASARMPARELADGGLILIGGTLMLAPGFVTDGFGVLLILPLTRPFFRRVLTGIVTRQLLVRATGPLTGQAGRSGAAGPAAGPDAQRPGPGPQGPVVRGEVVDDD